MQINQLSRADTVAAGDLVPIFSAESSDARAASITVISEFIQGQITGQSGFQTQYAAPNASGFSVAVRPTVIGDNVYLLLMPVSAYAVGAITMPVLADLRDGQEVMVFSTQPITSLSVTGFGAPTTLAANGFFKIRFDAVYSAWFRVG